MFETKYDKMLNELKGMIKDISTSPAKKKEIKVDDLIVHKKQEVIMKKQFTPETKEKGNNTKIINLKGLKASNSYKILDLKGQGKLKELTVSLNIKPDLYVRVNGSELYNNHASFDDLSTISEYSDVVSAITSVTGDNYIINIKEVKFTKSIVVSLFFNGNATINNIFCIYDLME